MEPDGQVFLGDPQGLADFTGGFGGYFSQFKRRGKVLGQLTNAAGEHFPELAIPGGLLGGTPSAGTDFPVAFAVKQGFSAVILCLQGLRFTTWLSQVIDDFVAENTDQPSLAGTPPVEAVASPPSRQERFLHQILRHVLPRDMPEGKAVKLIAIRLEPLIGVILSGVRFG